jgi:FMN hydrolase / 5-amino-6-(5-phospho-D-ribitylamino)uracil phosphatase
VSIAPATITTISFDGDGTLWDFEQVMRHALRHALAELRRLVGPAADALTVDTMVTIRERVAEELRGTVTNLEAVRLAAFKRTMQHIGLRDDDLAVHLNTVYLTHRFEDIRLFEDVLPTLEALRRQYKLGLVSNGNSYPHRCGLEGRFAFIVFSQDYGIEKPDPRLFQVAMHLAGCRPEEMLHVGDSLRNDVDGARRAGVRTAWLNRERRSNPTGIQPDWEIASLSELRNLWTTKA